MKSSRYKPQEDYELEHRRQEALDDADRMRRDDEVLNGVHKPHDIDDYLSQHPTIEFRNNE